MTLATLVRVATFVQIRDGSIPYLHWWAQSDMAFNDAWARDIASGNPLGIPAPKPFHRWHGEVAADAHRALGSREPLDEAWARALWNRWLGERSFYQDPLFAYGLAAVYAAGGGPSAALALQLVAGVVIAGLVALIACEVWGGGVGLIAGVLAALYAPSIFYESMLVRSTLQALTLAGAVAAAVHAARSPKATPWWIVCGVCGGLGILAHATSGLFVAGIGAWLVGSATRRRRVLPFALGVLVALAPLVARNLAVGIAPLETSSARAVNVITALAVDAEPRAGFHISAHTGRILAATNGRFVPTLRATLATHPGIASVLAQLGDKFLAFWESREATDNASFDYFLLHASLLSAIGVRFALIGPLAVCGMIACGRRWPEAAPLWIAAISVVVVALVFFPSSRVRFPVLVAFIPFAAQGLAAIARLAWDRRYRRLAVVLAGGLAAAVLVAAPWQKGRGDLRETDYGVGNEIAMLRLRAVAGDAHAELRIAEAQLRTEPESLRVLEPASERTVVPVLAAHLARSFARLHAAAAAAGVRVGDAERARFHVYRAEVLAVVARQVGPDQAP